MAKRVTPEMLLEQRLTSVVRRGLRVHGIEPGNPAYDIGVTVALGVLAALDEARRELGWTPPHPKTEKIGDATVEVGPDGTRVVTRADDTILVDPELLDEMEKLGNYTDNVFTLDTAGQFRYRSAGFFGPNAVFERIPEGTPQ